MKVKSVNILGVMTMVPSNVKPIVVSTSEENDHKCHIQSSERCIGKLDLRVLDCIQLKLW
jgi:hypothetical protein